MARHAGAGNDRVLCFIPSWNDFFYGLILRRIKAMEPPIAIVNFIQ